MTKILDDDVKKMMSQKVKACRFLFSAVLLASLVVLSGALPQRAYAAGLGKITVFSVLGQPLRAEVEIMASRDELINMSAQLAPQEAFKQMGLDYPRVLSEIEFGVSKRPNGQPIIKLSTVSPVNDPFVDMLLELSWPKGRIVREYTFLLDPQEPLASKQESAQGAVSNAPEVSEDPRNSRISNDLRSRAIKSASREEPPSSASGPQSSEGGEFTGNALSFASASSTGQRTLEVREGDTLYKIAREVKPEGVSLDRVLIGLFQANQKAFEGKNIHRIRSGQVLSVPDRQAFERVSSREAKRVIAQSSNWSSYRNTLAGMAKQLPAQEGQGRQGTAGKITPKVEDKAAIAEGRKDRVKVSPTQLAKSGASSQRSEEDRIASEKALNEANQRIEMLEKSVQDLRNLISMKDRSLAELEQRVKQQVVPPPQSAVPPQSVTPPPQQAAVSTPPRPAVQQQPVQQQPAVTSPPVQKPNVAVQRPNVTPRKPVILPEEPAETGIIDLLLDNWIFVAAGLGALALLGGGAYFFLRWRRSRGEEEIPLDSLMTMADEDGGEASVFQEDGGQSIDTSRSAHGAQSERMSGFSQASPGSIDTEEVDVIAEAEMYMTFNRDAQAEEVLLEAKQKDPARHDIHVKLLEIYAHRNDVKQFEALAVELFSETGGTGEEWEKAAALGLQLDPSNSLYGGNAQNARGSIAPPPLQESTIVMPGELSQMATKAAQSQSPQVPAESALDFNIGLNVASSAPQASMSLETTNVAPIAASRNDPASLEMTNIAPITSQSRSAAPSQQPASRGVDMNLGSSAVNSPDPEPAPPFNMSSIDLDLKVPDLVIAEGSTKAAEQGDSLTDSFVTPYQPAESDALEFSPAPDISSNEEVNTKLDLAKAYHDMGDADGARELLREVVQEGNDEQKGKAQAMLNQLGG